MRGRIGRRLAPIAVICAFYAAQNERIKKEVRKKYRRYFCIDAILDDYNSDPYQLTADYLIDREDAKEGIILPRKKYTVKP